MAVIKEVFQPGKILGFVERVALRAAENPEGVLREE